MTTPGQPLIITLQAVFLLILECHPPAGPATDWPSCQQYRAITAQEAACEFYLAINHGATGVPSPRSKTESAHQDLYNHSLDCDLPYDLSVQHARLTDLLAGVDFVVHSARSRCHTAKHKQDRFARSVPGLVGTVVSARSDYEEWSRCGDARAGTCCGRAIYCHWWERGGLVGDRRDDS